MADIDLDPLGGFAAAQKARGLAAEQLRKIAADFPDLFAEAAKQFMQPQARREVASHSLSMAEQPNSISATEAIYRWLDAHGPSTSRAMVEALTPIVTTRSKVRSWAIYSTLSSLERRKKIRSRLNEKGHDESVAENDGTNSDKL
jgi:hypothetical protein